jgi:hypothetical protein
MVRPVRSVLVACLALALVLYAGGAGAQTAPDLATGIRQVDEGDFEGAVVTLDAVVVALGARPGQEQPLSRAHLYLGIAYVALGQDGKARTHFQHALRINDALRLTRDLHSPKVVEAFEAARAELRQARGPVAKRRTPPAVFAAVGGAAAAVGIVLATRGEETPPGAATFAGARFGTPVIDCLNGSRFVEMPLSLLVEASNPTAAPVTITNVATVLVIVTSAIPAEVGLASTRPTTPVPASIAAGQSATVRLDTTLLCDNDAGDPFRFNEWSGSITFTTSAGVFTLNAADRLRVNVP